MGGALYSALAEALDALQRVAEGSHPDLTDAPVLDEWRVAFDGEGVSLVGRVTGHPRLNENALVQTSTLLAVSSDETWARTLNRFYRLKRPAGAPPMQ